MHLLWETFRYHANWTEIIQLIAAIIGTAINVWTFLDAVKDGLVLSLMGLNGSRRIVADINTWNEVERLFVQTIFVLIGIASVLLPPPYGPNTMAPEEAMAMTITRALLTAASCVKAYGSIYLRRKRATFLHRSAWTENRRDVRPLISDDRQHGH